MKTMTIVLVVSASLGTTALAHASDHAQRAQDLLDEAEYEQAASVLREALSQSGLDKSDLIELYSLQGTVLVALGRRERAEAAFRNLVVAQPSFELPGGTSPKVREVFDAVKAEFLDSGGLDQAFRPEHTPAGSVAPGNDVTLRLDIGARDRVGEISKVQIFYRRLGTPHYQSVFASQTPDGAFSGAVPGFFLDADAEDYAVEYYIEAMDGAENRLTGVGSSTLPLHFEVLGGAPVEPPNGDGDDGGGEKGDGSVLMTVGIIAGAVVVVGALVGVAIYFIVNQQGEGSAKVVVQAP